MSEDLKRGTEGHVEKKSTEVWKAFVNMEVVCKNMDDVTLNHIKSIGALIPQVNLKMGVGGGDFSTPPVQLWRHYIDQIQAQLVHADMLLKKLPDTPIINNIQSDLIHSANILTSISVFIGVLVSAGFVEVEDRPGWLSAAFDGRLYKEKLNVRKEKRDAYFVGLDGCFRKT